MERVAGMINVHTCTSARMPWRGMSAGPDVISTITSEEVQPLQRKLKVGRTDTVCRHTLRRTLTLYSIFNPGLKLTDGKRYQWQLSNGTSWKNIQNDQVIEINYCLPSTKGINIYNTPYG